MIFALLGLALVIAVLGIVNTLALSVIERTREVGLLRAIGVSRAPAALDDHAGVGGDLGARAPCSGVVLGIGFGVALMYALRDQGLEVISVPVGAAGGVPRRSRWSSACSRRSSPPGARPAARRAAGHRDRVTRWPTVRTCGHTRDPGLRSPVRPIRDGGA